MDIFARGHQVELETNTGWLNLSPYLVTEDVIIQDSPLHLGVIKTTCSLSIREEVGQQIDIRRNWPLWTRGKKVRVRVLSSTGTLHQVKELFILKSKFDCGRRALGELPQRPSLELELGDILSLREVRQLKTDDNGVTWNGIIQFIPYLNQWLTYFALPNLHQASSDPTISSWVIGPISYGGGSVSDHLGRMVYGYGLCHLYSDALGRLRLCKANPTPDTAYLDINANDLAPSFPVYRRSPTESEMPAGIVYVTANPDRAIDRRTLPCATSTTDARNLRHIETICTSWQGNTEIVTRTGTDTLIGINQGGPVPTPRNWKETTTRVYDGPNHAISSKTVIREEQPTPAPGQSSFGLVITKDEEYLYEYLNEVIRKITTSIRKKPPTENQPSGVYREYLTIIEEWIKRFDDTWTYLRYEALPDNNEEIMPTTILEEGENGPPLTQRRPSPYILKPQQVKGEADFSQTPGIDALHERTYNLAQYCPNNAIASVIAEELGKWLIGRYHGQNIAYAITDSWLNNPPEPTFNIFATDEGITDVYQLNSHALFLGKTQCYAGGAGIWLGTRDRVSNEMAIPYDIDYLLWSYDAVDSLVTDNLNNRVRAI
jgi:hypothetical protein